jgi:hypothetical protein
MESIIVRSKRKYASPVPLGYTRVSVDRSNTILGNPFELKNTNDSIERAKVIADYEAWITPRLQNTAISQALEQLVQRAAAGEKLAFMCWCDPKPCHGHFLQRLVKERVQELKPHIDGCSYRTGM